jgi:hypothetical protein
LLTVEQIEWMSHAELVEEARRRGLRAGPSRAAKYLKRDLLRAIGQRRTTDKSFGHLTEVVAKLDRRQMSERAPVVSQAFRRPPKF